jgi:hypothetical protein
MTMPVPANPKIASWSARAIGEYNQNHGGIGSFEQYSPLQPYSSQDSGVPLYLAQNSDPTYKIHCTEYACPGLEGTVIHMPTPYVVEQNGVGDAHMGVASPDKSETFSFYGVPASPSGSTINILSGTTFETNAIGWMTIYGGASNAGAASYFAGIVSAEDLLQGSINHAILLTAPCESGSVFPTLADPDGPCADGAGAPIGARLWLNMTDAQINAAISHPVERIVAKAIAHYGAYITDTSGGQFFQVYRSGAGGPASEAAAWTKVQSTILGGSNNWLPDDWPKSISNYFQFVDPCVAQTTC